MTTVKKKFSSPSGEQQHVLLKIWPARTVLGDGVGRVKSGAESR